MSALQTILYDLFERGKPGFVCFKHLRKKKKKKEGRKKERKKERRRRRKKEEREKKEDFKTLPKYG